MISQCGHFCLSMYRRSQSSQRTHSLATILGPRIAPHSHFFSQILHVLHSDQRLIRKTVRFESSPRNAPTGHRNRQYRFLTKTVAMSSTLRPIHIPVEASRENIQKGSTYLYIEMFFVTRKYKTVAPTTPHLI